jgi:hypothetical protein
MLKVFLNACQNHDLAWYMGFVDLVKTYNMANHDLLLCILKHYRAPPKFVTAIQTIYTDNICMLKIEKEIVEIPQSVGMQQGNNIAPVLFLILVTAFTETLEMVWREQEIFILSVMTASKDNLINGKICSHTPAMSTLKTLTAYKNLQSLYFDDSAFLFGMREDLKKGMKLVNHHFGRFGLEMHIRRGTSQSKPSASSSPRPPVLSTLTAPCCGCYNNPTSLLSCTLQQLHNADSGTTGTKFKLPHQLPCWHPRHCCFVPSHTCRQRRDCMSTHQKVCHVHAQGTLF